MKKLLLPLMAFLLIGTLLLAGCGGKTTTPAATTTTQATTATTATTTAATSTTTATTKPTTSATSTTTATTTTSATPTVNMYGGIYHYPLNVAPASPLGYPIETNNVEALVASCALERLFNVADGGVFYPRLAERWDVDAAAKTMTFYLRKGVKFHDGSDFNADVVKWNFDLQIKAGKVPNWESWQVIDPYTVKLKVKVFQNISLTGAGGYAIASKAAFDTKGIEYARENPVGTGPFIFVSHERGTKVTFKKNPNYWDTGKPYLDGVEFVIIADQTVRLLAFKRGDIHEFTAAGLDAKELSDLKYAVHQRAGGTFSLIPDSGNAESPLSILKVRQAISYAIDRESIAKNLGYGFARPAYQVYPGYAQAVIPDLNKTLYNPTKAKQLLADAGFPNGFKTEIQSQGYVVPANYLNAIAAMLTEVGIKTTANFPEAGKYSEYRFGSWKNAMLAQGLAGFDNLNSTISFYFGPTAFKSRALPANFVAATDASLASPQADPKLIQAWLKIAHEEEMVIPFIEEVVMIFQTKGAHNAGLDIATQTGFWSHLAWLEPSAR